MELMNELIVSVVGGVVTAVILERLRGGRRQTTRASTTATTAARPRRTSSFFGGLIRVTLSVMGGLFMATTGARFIFQSGLLERNPLNRMGLLVAGTVVVWTLLLMLRGKR